MKNIMVASFQPGPNAPSFTQLDAYVRAQIANSLEVGWAAGDILLLTNFDYEYLGVKAQRLSLDDARLRSMKVFALHALFHEAAAHEVFWVHDLDAWQNAWFDCPSCADVGLCEYSEYARPSFAGGSLFFRPAAQDLVTAIRARMEDRKSIDEETVFNEILGAAACQGRVTALNSTYNLGCRNFPERYVRAAKPIRVCHFHPDRGEQVALHMWGRNFLHAKTVDPRLDRLLRRYFPMPALGEEDPGTRGTRAASA